MFSKIFAFVRKLPVALSRKARTLDAQVVVHTDQSTLCSKTPNALKLPRFSSATGDLPVAKIELRVGGTLWSQVSTFSRAGSDDHVYVVDPGKGVVRFGNGVNGARPPAGQDIVVQTYDYGGGRAGSVTYRQQRVGYALMSLEVGNAVFRFS